jgi:hypothetical protein
MSDIERSGPGYEESDVNHRTLLWWVTGLVATLAISVVASVLLFDTLERRALSLDPKFSPSAPLQNPPPPEPRLVTDEPQDLASVLKEEQARLHSYDWVDKPQGIVRLPIERALEVLAKEGVPSRASAAGKAP